MTTTTTTDSYAVVKDKVCATAADGIIPTSKASVLDLGSNSAKIAHYKIDARHNYKLYYQKSVPLKLFEGLQNGEMHAKYVDNMVDTVRLFKEKTRFEGINHVVPVATSAIRDATNQIEIVDRIRKETGFEFRILSDEEEALYSYAGAIRLLQIPFALFFDIGGGSLEVVFACNYDVKTVRSFPLGALRLTRMFAHDSEYERVDFDAMKKHINKTLPRPEDLGIVSGGLTPGPDATVMVGSGGALRSLARYVQMKKEYPISKMHNYPMMRSQLDDLYQKILMLPTEKIAKFQMFGTERADTIRAATLVIHQLMKKMGFDKVTVSAHGLREGALALSMRHRSLFDAQKITAQHIRETVCDMTAPPAISESSRPVVDFLQSNRLLSDCDVRILHYALSHVDKLRSFRDIANILHPIMDDDTYLSHGDQLMAALALINTRKRKKADALLMRFESVAYVSDKKQIRKISAMISLCHLLDRISSRVTVAQEDSGLITITVSLIGMDFPELMLRQACTRVENALGVPLRCEASLTAART